MPLFFVYSDELATAGSKNIAPGEDRRRTLAQLNVGNQFQTQQRGKNTKRIARQRRVINRTKRGGVHRHAGLRQVVIADGEHPHNGKHTPQRRQFFRRANADRAVALDIKSRQLIGIRQLLMQFRMMLQHRQINVSHQLQ